MATLEKIKMVYDSLGYSEETQTKQFKLINNLVAKKPKEFVGKKSTGMGMIFDDNVNSYPCLVINDSDATMARKLLASDADTFEFNIPSSGVPEVFTTVWTNRVIKQMLKLLTINEVADPWQQGSFGTMNIQIPVQTISGYAQPYSDNSMNGNTSVNYNWINRRVGYFEQSISYGDMQQAQFGLAKMDYVSDLRNAMTETVAQEQNDIAFSGYQGIPDTDLPHIYGVINDPNLNAFITLPDDGEDPTLNPSTEWRYKTFEEQVRDFILMATQLSTQGGGRLTSQSSGVLALPTTAEPATNKANMYGKTFTSYLKENYPNIRIVTVPNFDATLTGLSDTVGMLMLDTDDGQKPFSELYTIKWQGHRPVPLASSISEKISYGVGGSICKYPLLVVSVTGI